MFLCSYQIILLFILLSYQVQNLSSNELNKEHYREVEEEEEHSANHFSDTFLGDPPDYPTYTEIPKTDFSCIGKVNWHYYADINADCQSFHVCETQHSKISFLCPIGSVFNQRHLVCDWWYNVDCIDSEELYHTLTNEYNDQMLSTLQEDDAGFDLSLASSGGNSNPSKTKSTAAVVKKQNENRSTTSKRAK